jgi:LuxR family transcriptional regulator, maltose regulon positive regulatory protein
LHVSEVELVDAPLIRTKLLAPVARALVRREALLRRLSSGPARRLTLVRAPAGWGKSSLLAGWQADDDASRSFAWLALDRGDNDPVRFFLYLIEALRSLAPAIGERSSVVVQAQGVSFVEDVLPLLINELEALPDPSVLVIDDYHLISSAEVHEAFAFLLEHLPPELELVISTRAEPPLPLARLRGRGELLELTVRELRFSVDEAATLLNEGQQLGLEIEDVDRLVERTEGWPAGLYLAALSLQGRDDKHALIRDFSGDDRHVVDYLTAEVLAGQDAQRREFLFTTSVLDRLSAPLCDAVTGYEGSAAILREIESSNFFLVPLDSRREWYRYHHLFGELLRHELRQAFPEREPDAHRRAAAWWLERGAVSEAIHHTIQAGDVSQAVELVALWWLPVNSSGGLHTVQQWLDALPSEVVERDSRLCVARAFVAIGLGQLDEVGGWIEAAARVPAGGPFRDGFTSGVAAASSLNCMHRWLVGDLGGSRAAAAEAQHLSGGWGSVALLLLGAATYWLEESDEGIAQLQAAADRTRAGAPHPPAVFALGMLASVHLLRGELDEAGRHAEDALALSEKAGLLENWNTALAHVARGGLLLRAGADGAQTELERGLELARRGSGPVETVLAMVAVAEARHRNGEPAAARELLAEARWTIEAAPDPGPVVMTVIDRAERRTHVTPRGLGSVAVSIDEFSDRELAVLRLLCSDLSQREIGGALYISFNTVKTHTKSLYRKLGVSHREDAVARARELELI